MALISRKEFMDLFIKLLILFIFGGLNADRHNKDSTLPLALLSRSPFPIYKQKDNPYLPDLYSSQR